METEQFHRLIDEKKWTLILREFVVLLSKYESMDDYQQLIWVFENLDKDFREQNAKLHYLVMWKIAFKCGKIKLAKQYASFILDHLIEMKRVPALKKLIQELSAEGLFKDQEKASAVDYILGRKIQVSLENPRFFEAHPEMWKNSKETLKNYLMSVSEWRAEQWKLAYEYVLKFHYDQDIFLCLAEKARELKKRDHKRAILTYLSRKKVNLKAFEKVSRKNALEEESSPLNMDYDQLAMDVMSGSVEPSIIEQKRIMITIQNFSDEELLEKGKDMIVAFSLLGMDKVVITLCERIIPIATEVKEKISTYFMLAQALFNDNDFYKTIDVVEDAYDSLPLLAEELLAFDYLKAESLLKLKKHKLAKDIFLKIKKQNSHYRLVGERLKYIEEIK